MPFTFSHPSVVLIIKKIFPGRLLSLTALIVGSMAPDFEGFILLQARKTFSHTWEGMFFFDLPVGFALCFLWHCIVRRSFIDNLPPYFKKRFYRYRNFNWYKYFVAHKVVVIVSLLIGILSHLLWDYYAHIYDPPVVIYGHEIDNFLSRQSVSSVVGFIVVMIFFFRMPIDRDVPTAWSKMYWLATAAIGAAITCLRYKLIHQHLVLDLAGIYMLTVVSITAVMLGILCVSIFNTLYIRLIKG
jgi:hypothetical protein